MSKLLIIEAPGKLKKLKQILPDWTIRASGGHIRELAIDKTKNGGLGFQIQGDRVIPQWVPNGKSGKEAIANLQAAVKAADQVLLATDEDREGETIGWHIADALGLKNPQRVTYREITESAVKAAIDNPRPLDLNLAQAGICRAVLDRLVGFKGSPLVWKLNNGAKSVGRVQSAALHLVATLETKIRNFKPQDYWTVFVDYEAGFRAFYSGGVEPETTQEEESDATDPTEQEATEGDRITTQAEADRLVQLAQSQPHQVISVEGKTVSRQPPAPFTTSTLQQAASVKLKLSPEGTMKVAQGLYEQGYITYMRTDATFLAPPFVEAVRAWLGNHDATNVPEKVTAHKSGKNAQEAHEGVRPTDVSKTPDSLSGELDGTALKLYELIWNRAVASLCKPARVRQTCIVTRSGSAQWQARGSIVEFEGFAKYWRSLGADAELPNIEPNQSLRLDRSASEKKQTKPPGRYSEAGLVQVMERKGIGRPSTFASTIETIKDRGYVKVVKNKLEATELGMEVDRFLSASMPDLVDTDFTAQMETQLDEIAEGKANWEKWLSNWNRTEFEPALQKAEKIMPEHAHTHETSQVQCPHCDSLMNQINSSKVTKGYFLKCPSCEDSVMFWSDRRNDWEPPQPKVAGKLTDVPCPACRKQMEEYHYEKDGEQKVMLRCSDANARKDKKHKDAVYFKSSKGGFWSPKHGEVDYEVAAS